METTDKVLESTFVEDLGDEPEYTPSKEHLWKPGQSGNPAGRPKGQSLKEFAREWYLLLNDEDKIAYLKAVEAKRPGFAWTMAEGNPTEDRNIKITVPTPILGGQTQQIQGEIVQEVLSDGKNEAQN